MMTSQETIARIERWIEDHAEEIIADLQSFSRIRSVSRADLATPGAPFGPECRLMLDTALKRGAEYGFETADHEGYCGSIYSGDLNNAMGLFGHLDVVPEGDKWTYPPYAATRLNDFLIGRGVGDNKCACVMGLSLLRLYRDLELPLKHGLRVVMGCSEETGMADMDYFAKTQTMPVISLVPDSNFPVNFAQKGTLRATISYPLSAPVLSLVGGEVENMVPPYAKALVTLPVDEVKRVLNGAGYTEPEYMITAENAYTAITAHGIASHAAWPEGGKSAIFMLATALAKSGLVKGNAYAAMKAIAEMSSDYYGVTAGIDCEDPESGKTTMVIGTARMDKKCVQLTIDCRLSIATDLDRVQQNFRDYCNRLGFSFVSMEVGRPFYMPKDDPRIRALMTVYQEMTGDTSPAYTMGGGTYSRCLKNALTFGPGFPAENERPEGLPEHHGGAHSPDEYLHLPSMLKALKIFAVSYLELDAIV